MGVETLGHAHQFPQNACSLSNSDTVHCGEILMDASVSEMEMCPQLPFPEWTPEERKKMQLARARKMLLEYEIKNNCIPGKNLRKKTDSGHYNAGVSGRRFRKRSLRAQEELKTTSSDSDSLDGVTASTGNPFSLARKLNGLIFEVEVRKHRTKSIQPLQDSLNYLHKFLLSFQQDLVSYEQMTSKIEQLHWQSLLLKELLEKKDQDMTKLQKIKKEEKETLELQNTTSLGKEQLQAQINTDLLDKQSRELKAVEVAMVVEVLKEEEEVAENVDLEGNLDSNEDSIEMSSSALAGKYLEEDDKTLNPHQTPELWEEQQTEDPRSGGLDNQNNENNHLARKHSSVLNWLPTPPLYPLFYRLKGPYPMKVFIV